MTKDKRRNLCGLYTSERNNYNPDSLSAASLQQLPNPLNNSRQQRFVAPALGTSNQFNNNLRLRTPPPNYNHTPATPPPSYKSNQSCVEVPAEVSALPLGTQERSVGQLYAVVDEQALAVEQQQQQQQQQQSLARPCGWQQRRQQLVVEQEDASNRHERQTEAAAAAEKRERQQQQQQQQRRRRRQQLAQRFANIYDSSTESSSNSSKSSSNSDSECIVEVGRFYHQRRRSSRARGLRDAYCPDLLNACSLILNSQQTHQNNLFSTDTSSECYSDYVELDEIRPEVHTRQQRRLLDYASTQQFSQQHLQHARSTPELRVQQVQATNAQQCSTALRRERREVREALNLATDVHIDVELKTSQRQAEQEMGQHLSLRRPRISLTWVLREQQQQLQQQQQQQQTQQQQQQQDQCVEEKNAELSSAPNVNGYNNNVGAYIMNEDDKNNETQQIITTTAITTATKRRHKLKKSAGANEQLNGYATTPSAHPAPAVASQKFFSNQNLLDYQEKRDASKELFFVCTPQRLQLNGGDTSEVLALAKRRNDIKKKFAAKMATLQCSSRRADGAEAAATLANGNILERDALTMRSLKGTYSEPSLIAASEGNHRRHRHRKRRERSRVQKFGYEIRNVDEFLSKCSLSSPANIPVVLSTSSTLYQTRPGGYQTEIPLPLGMVVNAVFKNQNWLYVQTPHAEEGYVGYACCLPLGILPPSARGGGGHSNSSSAKPTPCWESNGDVFPRPCGNMTDSEKEIRLRGGTRSDGARTPRGKRSTADTIDASETVTVTAQASYGEQRVDKLYLRAASQPKLAEKAFAQLRATKAVATNVAAAKAAAENGSNDEYVVLQQQKSKLHVQKHLQQQQQQLLVKQQQQHQHYVKSPPITNGYNGQHLHPSNVNGNVINLPRSSSFNSHQIALHAVKNAFSQHSLRQTLVAINTDYKAEGISVEKGEIVTLCECRESKDRRQWFYVKTRDGREGYIPAEVAGHGYL